jgi:phosphonate transport system substrate-binding protein
MLRKSRIGILLLCVVLAALLSASLVSAQDVGTDANPIQVYFVPSTEADVIVSGGEVMRAALEEATGLKYEVFVPTSYVAVIEAMCASPTNTIGFIPAAGYVIANDRCGVEVGVAGVRNGWNVYWAQYIVRRDSDIYTLGDLAGKTWGYGSITSTSGYIFPAVELANAGIEPGETVETGGHPQTVLAVYNGEVDFGTTFYSPPILPEGHAPWQIGDLPEPYDLTVEDAFVSEDGEHLMVGDIEILDARRNVRTEAPDVLDQVRILRLTSPIPNDTMSFGPDFPEELRQQILDALVDFSGTEAWAQSMGNPDFYGWTGISPIEDATFDIVRDMVAQVPSVAEQYE